MFKMGVLSYLAGNRFEGLRGGGPIRHLAKQGPMIANAIRKKRISGSSTRTSKFTGICAQPGALIYIYIYIYMIYGVQVPASMVIMRIMVMLNPSEKI